MPVKGRESMCGGYSSRTQRTWVEVGGGAGGLSVGKRRDGVGLGGGWGGECGRHGKRGGGNNGSGKGIRADMADTEGWVCAERWGGCDSVRLTREEHGRVCIVGE